MAPRLFAAIALATATLAAPAAFAASEEHLARCKAELSFRGALKIEGGQAVATNTINAAQARAINDCAAGLARRGVDSYPLYASHRACYKNAPILYRGNMYCYKGR